MPSTVPEGWPESPSGNYFNNWSDYLATLLARVEEGEREQQQIEQRMETLRQDSNWATKGSAVGDEFSNLTSRRSDLDGVLRIANRQIEVALAVVTSRAV